MQVRWYKIGNVDEFEKKGVPQIEITAELEELGQVDIVLIFGFNVSVIFQGEMLTIGLNGRNPFFKEKASAYIDPETRDLWVGYAVNM